MLACSLKIPLLFCRSRRAPRSHKNVQRTFLWDALLRHPPSLLILHAGTAPKERSSCHSTFLFPSSAQEQLRRSALPATQPSTHEAAGKQLHRSAFPCRLVSQPQFNSHPASLHYLFNRQCSAKNFQCTSDCYIQFSTAKLLQHPDILC